MRELFVLAIVLGLGGMAAAQEDPAVGQPEPRSEDKVATSPASEDATSRLAQLKAQLARAVEAGKLTKQQAAQKYAAAEKRLGFDPKRDGEAFEEFATKLKTLVSQGKLTEQEALDLYQSVVEDKANRPRVKASDYKVESLEEQRRLSTILPTTSTAGDQEGPVATGFFGWAADATHRFLDHSHRGDPRLIRGLSFRLDYRDHDSIGRRWEKVTIRIAHGDWNSIKYNASRAYRLVDEPAVVFDKPWSFPTLKGFPTLKPAEWGGPQNCLNFRFDQPFEYNGKDAIFVEFVFKGGEAEDGRKWEGDLPFGFEYFLDSMPEAGGWRVAERPVGLYRAPRVEAVVSYTAGGQSVWTSAAKGMPYLKWDFDPLD